MADDVKSRIEELEKELYSKDFKPLSEENVLTHKEISVGESWDAKTDALSLEEAEARKEKRHRMMKKITLFSAGFFFIATLVTSFVWWKGLNVVSGTNINIDISAPLAVAGGEPFDTNFVITNGNKVSVDSATLLVEYPSGFYSSTDKSELLRNSQDVGAILPGQVITEKISALLYGQENTSKEVTVTLEYRMAGSNAILKKSKTYAIKVSSSPVNITLGARKEANSGQETEFDVSVSSNTKDPTGALIVTAEYPAGFSFKSAEPSSTYNTNSWQIANLAPEETRIIKIHGILEGQENEEKITKISVGTQSTRDERLIGITYDSVSESTTITKPFLGLDVTVNNEHSPEYVIGLGKTVQAVISWQNNNPAPLSNIVIEAKLKGEVLNRYSVYASIGGFYRSTDDTIVWDKRGNPELRLVEPGARGSVGFSFSPRALDANTTSIIKNPQVTFDVQAHAQRTSASGSSEDVTTFASRTVKFDTDLRLGARATYFSGPFKNTGALPPKVDKETTYTVSFTVHNSSNSVSNAVVKTTLPIYVKWLNKISPEGEGVIYGDVNSEVTWNAGRIPAGGTRDVSFQISFLPSLSQVGQAPKLTGDVVLLGTDDFTKTELRDQKPPITTYLSSDPQVGQNQVTVVN